MIERVTGPVASCGANWAVVLVGGMGLKAWCSPSTAAAMRTGEEATLFTSLVPREDSLTLYGFSTQGERDAFELVQTASGVGPKLALAIVSVLAPADLVTTIAQGDVKRLTSVPGIGTKGAQKLIIELKDKIVGLGVEADGEVPAAPSPSEEVWRDQVVVGLQGLGWSQRDAEAATERVSPLVAEDPSLGVAELMRAALRTLAR